MAAAAGAPTPASVWSHECVSRERGVSSREKKNALLLLLRGGDDGHPRRLFSELKIFFYGEKWRDFLESQIVKFSLSFSLSLSLVSVFITRKEEASVDHPHSETGARVFGRRGRRMRFGTRKKKKKKSAFIRDFLLTSRSIIIDCNSS